MHRNTSTNAILWYIPRRNKVVKKFQDITAKEIKDGNYPKASKDSDSIAKRYSKPEIFHNSQEER